MKVPLPVGIPYLGGIDMTEPVVGGDFARNGKNHPPEGKSLVGIRIHAPIAPIDIFRDRSDGIDHRRPVLAELAVLFPVHDVGSRRAKKSIVQQGALHKILDLFHAQDALHRRAGNVSENLFRQCARFFFGKFACGSTGARERGHNLCLVKAYQRTIPFAHASR